MHIYPLQIDPSPPIEHRSLENQYTKYISYIVQCIYTHGRLTPPPVNQAWISGKPLHQIDFIHS